MSNSKSLKTNYIAHESKYARRFGEGKSSWGDVSEKSIATIQAFLSPHNLLGSLKTSVELGCGGAQLSAWFAGQGVEVKGVDISPTGIKMACNNFEQANLKGEFVVGSVLGIPEFETGAFDLVVDGHCLHCIIGADRPLFFAEAMRLVRPNGYILIKTMCGDPENGVMLEGYDPESRCLVKDGVASRYLGRPESILAEIKDAGLSIFDSKVIPRDGVDDMDELLVLAQSAKT